MNRKSPVKSRKVSLSFNPASGRFSIRPKTIALSSGELQEVLWRSRNATFEIRFEPDCTPFRAFRWRCPTGGGCLSGIPKRRRGREKCIKYTITLLGTVNGNGASARAGSRKKRNEEKTGASPQHRLSREAYLLLK